MRTPRYCLQQAEAIGPACLALVTRLFGDRVLDRLRNVQGLLRLAEKFGDDRLEARLPGDEGRRHRVCAHRASDAREGT